MKNDNAAKSKINILVHYDAPVQNNKQVDFHLSNLSLFSDLLHCIDEWIIQIV